MPPKRKKEDMPNILDVMEERGFNLAQTENHVEDPSFMFLNDNKIICKVYMGKEYEFIYTNNLMTGFLSTGKIKNVFNNEKFNTFLADFCITVKVLKDYYEGES